MLCFNVSCQVFVLVFVLSWWEKASEAGDTTSFIRRNLRLSIVTLIRVIKVLKVLKVLCWRFPMASRARETLGWVMSIGHRCKKEEKATKVNIYRESWAWE